MRFLSLLFAESVSQSAVMRTATPRFFAARFLLAPSLRLVCRVSRKRKKTYKPKEGWEDGTPPPHTGISREGKCVASRRPPLGVCLFLSLFASPSPILAATFMPPRGRPTLVVLSSVASSSVSSVTLLCLVLRRRCRLPIPGSRGISRLSAQLRKKNTKEGRDGRTARRHQKERKKTNRVREFLGARRQARPHF